MLNNTQAFDNQVFSYVSSTNMLVYKLSGGQIVSMTVYNKKIVIKDSYLLTKAETKELVEFITWFINTRTAYKLTQPEKYLYGEIRLHKLLYLLHYKRNRTKDCDLDYEGDRRWYVNLLSKIIGTLSL